MSRSNLEENTGTNLRLSESSNCEDSADLMSSAGPTFRPLLQQFHSSQATFVNNINSPHSSSFRRSRRISTNSDGTRNRTSSPGDRSQGLVTGENESEIYSEKNTQHRPTVVHDWQNWNYERTRRRFYRETKAFSVGDEERVTFDRIVKLAQRRCKTLYAAMNLVGPSKIEIVANSGPIMDITNPQETICSYLVSQHAPEYLIVPDATQDPRFSESVFVTAHPFIRFYAGVPLIVHGYRVGTLTIADTTPRPDLDKEDTKAVLLDLAGILSTILMEQRNKAMSFDNDFAKISVGLFTHLQQPLQLVNDACIKFQQSLTTIHQDQFSFHGEKSVNISNNNDEETESKVSQSPTSHLITQALLIKDNVDFLSLSVENFLQLSLSLFQRLQESEAADVLPIREIPALMYFLSHSLHLENYFQRNIEISTVELCSFQEDDDETLDESNNNMPITTDKSLASISSQLTTDWLAGVNVSMLWTLLFSVVCNHDVSNIRLLIHHNPRNNCSRKRSDDCARPAFLAIEFVIASNDMPRVRCCSHSNASPRAESNADDREALHHALQYLINGMSGDIVLSYDTDSDNESNEKPSNCIQCIRVELPIHVVPPPNALQLNDPSSNSHTLVLNSNSSHTNVLQSNLGDIAHPHPTMNHDWLNSNTDDITGTEASDSERHVLRNPHAHDLESSGRIFEGKIMRIPPSTLSAAYVLANRPRISCAAGMSRNNSRDSMGSFFVPSMGTRMHTMSLQSVDKQMFLSSGSHSSNAASLYPSLRLSLPPAEEEFDGEAMAQSKPPKFQQQRSNQRPFNTNSFVSALFNCLKLTGRTNYKQKNKIGQIVECDDTSVSQTGLIFADNSSQLRRHPNASNNAHGCANDDQTYDETQQSIPTTPTTMARWLRRMSASSVASQTTPQLLSPTSASSGGGLIIIHRPTSNNIKPIDGCARGSNKEDSQKIHGFRSWLWSSMFFSRNPTKEHSSNKIVPLIGSQYDSPSMELISQ